MFLSDLSIKRPILVSMVLLVFIVFGALAYFVLPLNLMPDINLPFVIIQTVYPGAGPSEVETQVTKRIEDALATVSLVDYTQSYSMENASVVLVAFKTKKNVDIANQEVKDKVDAILRDLPEQVEKPVVMKLNMNTRPFMDIILSGKLDARELHELADTKLKDRFGQIPGVGEVTITGGAKRQIDVTLKDQVVYENRLSMTQLLQILAAQNLDMPAGNLKRGTQEYSVRLKGQYQGLDEIADADIPTAYGVKKLRDLADITDSSEEVRSRAIFHNMDDKVLQDNVVRISLTNASDGNVVDISKEVKKILPEIQADLPEGVSLDIVQDGSTFIRGTVEDTFVNIGLGILLTGLVLLLFLHDWRSTFIVALSMPIAIISTFVFLQVAGYSFNLLTLIGISVSVGILVTNSVVVIENIFRHKSLGLNNRDAAAKGASEIAVAVLASTLTNVVVFLPIASMSSLAGQFFREFALTVTFATMMSLLTAFTVTPMLAARILPEKPKPNRFGEKFDNIFNKFATWYRKFLGGVLSSKKRSRTIIFVTLGILVASLALIPVVGLEFIPEMDQGEMSITVELPQGYNIEQTAQTLTEIHKRLEKHKEIDHVITNLGSSGTMSTGTNLASSTIKLVDTKHRKLNSRQVADLVTRDLADIPNALIKVSAVSSGFGEATGLEFYLQGQDNARLEQLKHKVTALIKDTPGLINLDTSTRGGRADITIRPKRAEMAAVNATTYELALAVRGAIEGLVSTQYHEGDNQYDIKLSLEDESVDSPEKLENLSVTINWQPYPLSQLADITFEEGTNIITHRDRHKTVVFTADVAEGARMGNVMKSVNKRLDGLELPKGYGIIWGGNAEMMTDMISEMIKTLILAVLLTYMLLAAILENLLQPLLILGTVPLAIIGVILSLLITGQTFNLVSLMSIVMLVGIVVNNAILMLDHANGRRKEGADIREALMEAGEVKLKPIIMSTLAIAIGMLPMALGIGPAGLELRKSMGIVMIGGLIVSAFLTLVIIPAFYYLAIKQQKTKVEVVPDGNV